MIDVLKQMFLLPIFHYYLSVVLYKWECFLLEYLFFLNTDSQSYMDGYSLLSYAQNEISIVRKLWFCVISLKEPVCSEKLPYMVRFENVIFIQ